MDAKGLTMRSKRDEGEATGAEKSVDSVTSFRPRPADRCSTQEGRIPFSFAPKLFNIDI
jgi:hypothetical protein